MTGPVLLGHGGGASQIRRESTMSNTRDLISTLPISFQKRDAGKYESIGAATWVVGRKTETQEEIRAPLFRIHRSVHTGRMYGKSRIRWHVTHAPSGATIGSCSSPEGNYELTLKDAVTRLNQQVARGIERFMRGLAALVQNAHQARLDAEHAEATRAVRAAARNAMESRIRDAILGSRAVVFQRESGEARFDLLEIDHLVRDIADAAEAP